MYNLGDNTYRNQPKVMSTEVVLSLFTKVRNHCLRHQIETFTFIFHGGEPILAGEDFFRFFVSNARKILGDEISPIFVIQTNGVLLNEEWCELLGKLHIGVGISIDGTPEINDKFRIDHAGRGSYDKIIEGLTVAKKSDFLQDTPVGLLSVIDVTSDPILVYTHLKSLGASNIDFLIPDATHDSLPLGFNSDSFEKWETPYADWLIAIFDIWLNEKNPCNVRIFESIILLLFGRSNDLDTLGSDKNEVLVIETDGSIEPIGQLKICGEGFTKVGMNIINNELDEAMQTPLIKLFYRGGEKICKICHECPISEICAGGYLPHRYKKENGFNNPSIYCHDLLKLITHIQNSLLSKTSQETLHELGVTPFSYEIGKKYIKKLESSLSYADEELEFFKQF